MDDSFFFFLNDFFWYIEIPSRVELLLLSILFFYSSSARSLIEFRLPSILIEFSLYSFVVMNRVFGTANRFYWMILGSMKKMKTTNMSLPSFTEFMEFPPTRTVCTEFYYQVFFGTGNRFYWIKTERVFTEFYRVYFG